MTITKRQHYVPRFYLRYFTNPDGQLHACRRENGTCFKTSPENVCAENYLYEVDLNGVDGDEAAHALLDNYIERQLSGAEGRLAPFYKGLLRCCEEKTFEGKEFLDGRLAACILAANIIVRHPLMLRADRANAKKVVEDVEAEGGITDQEQAALEHYGLGEKLETVTDLAIMQTMLFSDHPDVPLNRIYNALADKRMTIVEAPALMRFITTSLPVYFLGIDECNYAFDVAFMPLSYRYAALFTDDKNVRQFSKATIEEAVQFNVALLDGNDVWDVAVANARGALDVAMWEWKKLRRGVTL